MSELGFASVKVQGRAWRKLTCEQCGKNYYSLLNETVRVTTAHVAGFGAAEESARRQAEDQLHVRLYKAVHPIPCCHCGWIQEDMIPIYKERASRSLGRLGGILLSVGLVTLGIAPAFTASHLHNDFSIGEVGLYALWGVGVLSTVVGFILFRTDRKKRQMYDPNLVISEQDRLAEGKKKAVSEQEYLRQIGIGTDR